MQLPFQIKIGNRICRSLAVSTGLVCCALAWPSAAQTVGTAVQAEAVVVTPLSFFKVDDLVFGSIVPSGAAGTVVIAPSGARTKTGGVILASGATPQPARFAGMGSRNQAVNIRLGSNSVTLNRVGGGGNMTMNTFIIGSTPTAQLTTAPTTFRIASSTGMFLFPVGATLRVKANQAPGSYTGNFAITLQYQ